MQIFEPKMIKNSIKIEQKLRKVMFPFF